MPPNSSLSASYSAARFRVKPVPQSLYTQ
jgi:hypothetical protein